MVPVLSTCGMGYLGDFLPEDPVSNKSDRKAAAIRRKKNRKMIFWAAGVGVVFVVGGLIWYFTQSAPEEVSLASAAADAASSQSDDPAAASGASVEGVEGTWTVDTSVGEFNFEDSTASFVGFRIQEELVGIGAATAVGRTGEVQGAVTIEGTSVTETVIVADLTQIVTNASRRNRAVQFALNTAQFPTATFTLTSPVEIGDVATSGEVLVSTMSGTLELNGVVQPVEIPFEAQLVGELIVLVGSTDIIFLDWGVGIPSAQTVVSVEDNGILEIQLFLTRG